jgi:putative hydrolase of the HAD superfamily
VTTRFDVVAFDADDTLWHSEDGFHRAEKRIHEMMAPYVPAGVDFEAAVRATERDNVVISGFGVKPWILSVIQAAVAVSNETVPAAVIGDMIDIAHELLMEPVRLIDGVPEVLDDVGRDHRLVMITKGDLVHQHRKAATSGIDHHFEFIHVVVDKEPGVYRRILVELGISPDRFVMIGNSVKSDILPVMEIGGHAVHIGYHITWEFEHIDHDEDVVALTSIREVPGWLRRPA